MPSSAQLTQLVLSSPNPMLTHEQLIAKTRYWIAHSPASTSNNVTNEQYYNGARVIPGPLADETLVAKLDNYSPAILKMQGINFIDHPGTSMADAKITMAAFAIMGDAQADDYERQLRALKQAR